MSSHYIPEEATSIARLFGDGNFIPKSEAGQTLVPAVSRLYSSPRGSPIAKNGQRAGTNAASPTSARPDPSWPKQVPSQTRPSISAAELLICCDSRRTAPLTRPQVDPEVPSDDGDWRRSSRLHDLSQRGIMASRLRLFPLGQLGRFECDAFRFNSHGPRLAVNKRKRFDKAS
jgi:hypothetical protein